MKNIDDLLKDKKEFQNEFDRLKKDIEGKFNDFNVSKNNLMSLFYLKNNIFNELRNNNLDETLSKLYNIDDKIYNQFVILRSELIDEKLDKKSDFEKIFKKYYDKKNLKDIGNFLNKVKEFIQGYYLQIIIVVGTIPFCSYFLFNKGLNYFPVLDNFNVISIFGEFFIIGIVLFIIYYIIPTLHIIFIYAYKDKIKEIQSYFWWLFGLSIIVLVIIAILITHGIEPNAYMNLFILAPIIFILVLYHFHKHNFEIIPDIVYSGLLFLLDFIFIFCVSVIRLEASNFTEVILYLLPITLSIILILIFLLNMTYFFFRFAFTSLIIINLFTLFFMSDEIIKISNYGNIDYNFIVLDKDALGALPSQICIKDNNTNIFYIDRYNRRYDFDKDTYVASIKCNNLRLQEHILKFPNDEIFFKTMEGQNFNLDNTDNINFINGTLEYEHKEGNGDKDQKENMTATTEAITYISINDNNKTIILHNIKALSAIGKFYYLQTTILDENNKAIRFEIDSNFIKSKQIRNQIIPYD